MAGALRGACAGMRVPPAPPPPGGGGGGGVVDGKRGLDPYAAI